VDSSIALTGPRALTTHGYNINNDDDNQQFGQGTLPEAGFKSYAAQDAHFLQASFVVPSSCGRK